MGTKVVHTSHAGVGLPKRAGSKMKGNVPRSDGLKSSGKIKSPNRMKKTSAGKPAKMAQGGDRSGISRGLSRTRGAKNNLTDKGFQGMRG